MTTRRRSIAQFAGRPHLVRLLVVASTCASIATVLAGCKTIARAARDPAPGTPVDSTRLAEPVPLDVDNSYKSDVTIYLARGGLRRRLGTVPPNSRRQLVVPAAYVNDQGGFVLVADPVAGGQGITSQSVVVHAGQRLVWTLESRLSRSVLAVQ